MWKLLALLIHILMLGFISLIYYPATINNGMRPQAGFRERGINPPSDRLVVFLIDGLRAESLYRQNCSAVPRLQHLIADNGLMGISQGVAPTESRPGHIAIFGGFNEDASAALTNFRYNPTAFDTVLNRTAGGSWAWGAKSALEFFKLIPKVNGVKMHTNLDLSSNYKEQWIYDTVRKFLTGQDNEVAIKKVPSVYLIDFEDIQRLEHVAPNSGKFLNTLNHTEDAIISLHSLFESTFKDKRTTYLLTSDHGMTDKGTHGGGSKHETEMPFIFWGAGVKRNPVNTVELHRPNVHRMPMKMPKVKQTQLAPLMSSLIGLPPPMNNRALLPVGLMNVNSAYEAHSLHLNALQVLEEVQRVLELVRRSQIYKWLPRFERLDDRRIRNYKDQIQVQMKTGCFYEAMLNSGNMIKLSLDCLEYYRVYYRIPLVLACIVTYMGWFFYLLAKQSRPLNEPKQNWITVSSSLLLVLETVILIICYLHRIPGCVGYYLLVPLPVWILALRERGLHTCCLHGPIIQLAWISGAALLLISSFYYEQLIALGYVFAVCANNGRAFIRAPRVRFWAWLALVALLTGFTVKRPSFGHNSPYLLCLSMLVTMLRPLILNERHACRVWMTNGGALLLGAYLMHQRLGKSEASPVLQCIAWCYIGYAMISIPYSDTKTPRHRVQLIFFNLSTIYTMLCLSYESMFVQLLCSEFLLGIQVHEDYKRSDDADGEQPQQEQELERVDDEDKPDESVAPIDNIQNCYRYAVLILVYAYISMIGTGNLPNLNTLDPSVARVFVFDCSTILVGSLIVLKLMIPVLIVICSIYAFSAHARRHLCGIFICLFLVCDVMCLYFFFFVRNSGSWRSVRDSLSQQTIVHGLPMLLAIFSWLPKQLLSATPLTMLPMLRWKSTINLARPGQSLA